MKVSKFNSTSSMDSVIEQMERDLKSLKGTRRKRSDSGAKRKKYASDLPKQYKQYISSANKRQIKFELSVEEFNEVVGGSCVYCGSSTKIGVDRKDSSEGYHIENVQPCCGVCNLMKYTHSEEFFIKHISKIYRYRDLK